MSDEARAVADAPAIQSRAMFSAAVQWGVDAAAGLGARRLLFIDTDFRDWPLDDAALLQSLDTWLRRPQRRLTLIARDWGSMRTGHPRFCAWRRAFGPSLETRTPDVDDAPTLPTMLIDDTRVCVRVLDTVHWRGRCSLDLREARLLLTEFDALAQRSAHDFPVTPLGL